MSKKKTTTNMLLDGGCFCFNFINTVSSRNEADAPCDYMNNYDDLLKLIERTGIMSKARRTELSNIAKKHPQKADKVLSRMKEIREKLYPFFSSIAAKKTIKRKPMEHFNKQLSEALSKLRFTTGGGELRLSWPDAPRLEEPLWRVMKSAYTVLTEKSHDRIKECEACGWIFLDQSKNKSRRWCNMKTCGSTYKSKKYYHRKKRKRNSE